MKRRETKAAAAPRRRPDPDRYLALVRRFPLRPLRSEEDLTAAVEVLDGLLDRMPDLDEGESDYLHVLGTLIREYELEHHPIEPASDANMLASLMDSRGLNQTRVAEGAGLPHSVVSEVLKGKRRLSRNAVGRLAEFFRVSPAVFAFASRPEGAS